MSKEGRWRGKGVTRAGTYCRALLVEYIFLVAAVVAEDLDGVGFLLVLAAHREVKCRCCWVGGRVGRSRAVKGRGRQGRA